MSEDEEEDSENDEMLEISVTYTRIICLDLIQTN